MSAFPVATRPAQVIVNPRCFRGRSGAMELLRLATRLGCELLSSRRGNVVLVPRERGA